VKVVEKVGGVPLGPWQTDEIGKKVRGFHRLNLTEGATSFGLRIFQTVFGWSKERTEMQRASLMKDMRNRAFHTYSVWYVTLLSCFDRYLTSRSIVIHRQRTDDLPSESV